MTSAHATGIRRDRWRARSRAWDDQPVVGAAASVAAWALDVVLFSDLATPTPTLAPVAVVAGAAPVLVLLLLRRRHPVAVALLVSACVPPALLVLSWSPALSVALVVYTAASRSSARSSLMCLGAALSVSAYALVEEVNRNPQLERAGSLIGVGTIYLLLEGGAWAAGRRSAAQRQRTADLEEQRDRALAAERARVSRELHDIVAHAVTVMLLHAAVGRRAVAQGAPETAAEALGVIEDVGAQAVNELRRMLGLLRADSEATGADPLPTVDAIPQLVDGIRQSGLDVEIRTTGDAQPLDPSVSLAAFRAVQEALTNTLRHAGAGARTTVELAWTLEQVQVCVLDDGDGRTDPRLVALSTGTGLVGLQERVAIAGGSFTCGPRTGGGWRLDVRLPVRHPGRRAAAVEAGGR